LKQAQPKLNCTIVIVNYNAGDYLATCVNSCLDGSTPIIIVDNNSSDNSLKQLQTIESPLVSVIYNNTNMGFAAACNIGYAQSRSDYVLFLNPDCQLNQQTLPRLIQTLQSDSKIAMVGGFLSNPDGSEQPGGRRAVPTPWRSFVRAFGLHYLEKYWPQLFFDFHLYKQAIPTEPIEVEAISGACMLVKRIAVNEVGLWDEAYFLHCEDLDWCLRFRQKGWKIFFIPNAKVIHAHGVCSRTRPIFVEWHKHKGMIRFYKKFFKHQYPGPLMGLVILAVSVRFLLVSSYFTLQHIIKRFKR